MSSFERNSNGKATAMKVVILAGGLGTRLREETEYRPKPMVEIGGRPMLWHIMKIYARYGFTDFLICLGYKGDTIRDYFLNYELRNRDFTITLGSHEIEIHNRQHAESGWRVTLAETGESTQTGGRLKRIADYVRGSTFMATYGDAVADIDIARLLSFHRQQRRQATVTAVRPLSRFGELSIKDGIEVAFREKPQVREGWVNGGFLVFEPQALDLIAADEETLEHGLLTKLASFHQLAAYRHEGFWRCMDTYREKQLLDEMWRTGKAPWALWENYQIADSGAVSRSS
jgi:glucose-1-phosphate cytidylyltransferase